MNLTKLSLFSLKIILILFVTKNFATTYYVSSKSGNDQNDGKSVYSAWRTIEKINISEFYEGDSILFKRGDIWRKELNIPASGSNNEPFYIGSYGEGPKPKIFGSEQIKYWENFGNNIWISDLPRNASWIWLLNNDKIIWGNKKDSQKELSDNYDFCFTENSVVAYLDKDPNSFTSIECSVRDFGIISGWYGEGKNNIEIRDLEIAFTIDANVRGINCENWLVENVTSHHSGAIDESNGQGIQFEGENSTFLNNLIFENGQHGFYLSSAGHGVVKNNLIEGNEIFNNYHTGIDIMNHGGNFDSHQNTVIRNNLLYDTDDFNGEEVGIQVYAIDGMIKNVFIHHNIVSHVRGIGISVVTNSDSVFVHNNLVYETESASYSIDNGEYYSEVINNIGVNNNYYAVVFIKSIENKKFDYNNWYTEIKSNTQLIFSVDNYFNSIQEFSEVTGFEKSGLDTNPMLIIKNKMPIGFEENSKCINSGSKLNYKYDFYGKQIQEFEIGPFEY